MIVARALAEYSLKRYALATHSCSWILLLADSSSARLSGFSLLSILNEAALKTENNVKLITIMMSVFLLAACEPQDRTPGMWLSGERVETKVTDWSFSDEFNEIFVQTNPWYGIPFSVTVVVASTGNKVYVPSIYAEPADFPGSKYWNNVIADSPDVVLKMGDKLYPRRARLVTDVDEFEMAYEALAAKYEFWREGKNNPDKRPPFVLISMDDRK